MALYLVNIHLIKTNLRPQQHHPLKESLPYAGECNKEQDNHLSTPLQMKADKMTCTITIFFKISFKVSLKTNSS